MGAWLNLKTIGLLNHGYSNNKNCTFASMLPWCSYSAVFPDLQFLSCFVVLFMVFGTKINYFLDEKFVLLVFGKRSIMT